MASAPGTNFHAVMWLHECANFARNIILTPSALGDAWSDALSQAFAEPTLHADATDHHHAFPPLFAGELEPFFTDELWEEAMEQWKGMFSRDTACPRHEWSTVSL